MDCTTTGAQRVIGHMLTLDVASLMMSPLESILQGTMKRGTSLD
jgi:hypothetical protein